MYLPQSCLLLLCVAIFCSIGSIAAPDSHLQGPRTVAEVRDALHKLGFELVNGLHEPPTASIKAQCLASCNTLGQALKDQVSSAGSASYNAQQSAYWSAQQAETLPACRVLPKSSKDVAAALIITTFYNCPFAVKSGGHAAFAGASGIQDGVTIDLNQLRAINVSTDRTLTRIGPGNRWGDVYRALTPLNLAVIGGRVSGIGVGGLTLGGGISFLSGRHGWACDNVRNYEVVLANGQITNVNYKSYPDLYFALRGGGNNFGIVTRFDLETFEQGQFWGGMRFYTGAVNASMFKAFDNFASNAPQDPDAALIVAFAYYNGSYIFGNDYEYAKPVVNPPIFHEFMDIESLSSTLRVTNLTDLTDEIQASNPDGLRETYTTATFRTSPVLQAKILEIFVEELDTIKDAASLLPSLIYQPLSKNVISYFGKNGGNALGIEESDGPLIVLNIAIMWASPNDDARIFAASNRMIDRSIAAAKELNLDYRFLYQNYASARQDVFASYGKANHKRLIQISKKYDPRRVFQRLQPGYFKLRKHRW